MYSSPQLLPLSGPMWRTAWMHLCVSRAKGAVCTQLQPQSVGANIPEKNSYTGFKHKATAMCGDPLRTCDAHRKKYVEHNVLNHGGYILLNYADRIHTLAIFALFSWVGAWERHGK